MPKTYRVAVAGLVHDHVWQELAYWKQTPGAELVGVADPNAELVERAKREFGIPQAWSDPVAMLDAVRPQIVQVCASNRASTETVVAAAERGVHAIVEKPMAHTLAGADAMLAASRQNQTLLAVNWPIWWSPAWRKAIDLASSGAIGAVFHARYRMAHEGPREIGCSSYFCDWLYNPAENGGGALIDYCSYGAALARLQFGRPRAVQGVAGRLVKTDITVEDNASLTLIYDHLLATTEGSWCERPWHHDAAWRGTHGIVFTHRGKLFLDTSQHGGPEEVECPPLAPEQAHGPAALIAAIETGEPLTGMISPEISRDAQEILDAGQRSVATGQRIELC
jgi:predicted dehydrogenase